MRNKDVLYVSNATSVQVTKFLLYLRTIMATANDPITYATNFYVLKIAINGTGNLTTIVLRPHRLPTEQSCRQGSGRPARMPLPEAMSVRWPRTAERHLP